MKKKEQLTEEQISLLKHIITLKKLTGDDTNRMYNLYRHIYEDKGFICSKCGRVIRSVFNKLKQYHAINFK
jgi:formamidopyrimidine-DNA glycosylase